MLKDTKVTINSKCWWGLHHWSKWNTYSWIGTTHIGSKITQTNQSRQCDDCGIEQHRVVEYAAGARHGHSGKI
jgi:hypothetical protein